MQLLSEMDGFNSRGDVCILAATNRWDILDPALIRAGRFDRLVYVPMPDREACVKILLIHTEKMRLFDDIDFDRIAALADGANGATLRAIAMEAGMCAVRADADAVHQKDFEAAIKHIMNPEGMVDRYSEGMFV